MDKKQAYERIKLLIDQVDAGHYFMDDYVEGSTLFEDMLPSDKELFENMILVDQYGGEEQGENYYSIWHFPKYDVYIKFHGWYYSYDGTTYDRMYQVEPKEVLVTQYNAV